jgi:hypothetical protein
MKCYYLFLDDERVPKDVYRYKDNPLYVEQVWIKAKNYDEFLDKVSERYAEGYLPCVVSLDHDLAPEHYALGALTNFREFDETAVTIPTGWHCLKWYLRFCDVNDLQLPKIMFHTKNVGGMQNMVALIDEYKFNKHKENG